MFCDTSSLLAPSRIHIAKQEENNLQIHFCDASSVLAYLLTTPTGTQTQTQTQAVTRNGDGQDFATLKPSYLGPK